jgi:hypothetical protein
LQALFVIEPVGKAGQAGSGNNDIAAAGVEDLSEEGKLCGAVCEPVEEDEGALCFASMVKQEAAPVVPEREVGFRNAEVLEFLQRLIEGDGRLGD